MGDHESVMPEGASEFAGTALPAPAGGAGSRDLAIDATDPEVLRRDLIRAQERLAFYESFDRIIGENIRRSGELMLETIRLREESATRERAAAEEARARRAAAESDRIARSEVFGALLAEIDRIRASVDTLRDRITHELSSLGVDASAPAGERAEVAPALDAGHTRVERAPEFIPDVPPAESPGVAPALDPDDEPRIPSEHAVADESAAATGATPPRTIDVLIQSISRAATAVALQRYLSSLAYVTGAETREFAEGILRLSVTSTHADGIADVDLAAWNDNGALTVTRRHPSAIELALS